MEDNKIGSRVESDKKIKDNEWYCLCCDKVLKSGHIDRHKNSKGHKHRHWLYRYDDFKYQIMKRAIKKLNKRHYNDDEWGKIFQRIMDKYDKAFSHGYFNKLESGEKIDFADYETYHKFCKKHGCKSLHPEDNTSDDE